ncbi:hypothetical protein CBR_g11937 [Chara braunii]|uniref:Uncharacterized protein n=1 Tax=Chara braunii TaxID=69332 RepID=A0A388KQP7_CHABU|nr:hypothetical protein CBR_g11937 [Chara braunii]|eukprot:GBG72359.1 hypothetical protein CBR_g11937 [Chara braunii]
METGTGGEGVGTMARQVDGMVEGRVGTATGVEDGMEVGRDGTVGEQAGMEDGQLAETGVEEVDGGMSDAITVADAAKKEEEERLKREEFEGVAKEEAKRIELEKKGEEEKKEADRNWSIRKLFSEQRVFLRKEVRSAVNEELYEMVKQEGKKLMKEGGGDEWEEEDGDEEEEDEEEEEEEERVCRRGKRVVVPPGANGVSPPAETPPKAVRGTSSRQPVFVEASPVEEGRKARGRPKKKEVPSLELDPWNGVPCSADYRNRTSYKVAVAKFVLRKLVPEVKMMCRREGIVWRGKKNEAVEELTELRVMHSVFESAPATGMGVRDSDLPKVEGHVTFKLTTLRNVPDALKNAKDSIRKVGRDLAKEVNDALLKFGLDGSVKPGDVWKAIRVEGNGERGYTDNAVERWRKLLVNFVRVPLDKNPPETLVMCPKVYADGMRDMFWGKESFDAVIGSEEDVLAGCKGKYEEGGFDSLGKWDGKGRLGHAYILPKNKDIGRFRPITPSHSKPSKQAGQRVARALNGMIALLPPSGHFNLKSTGGLKRRVEEITRWAQAKGEGGTIKGMLFDVKEMFNELPHASILKVVEWLRGMMKKKKREGVYVKKRGKRVSFANRRDKDWLFVSVDQVMDYVRYELDNTFLMAIEGVGVKEEGGDLAGVDTGAEGMGVKEEGGHLAAVDTGAEGLGVKEEAVVVKDQHKWLARPCSPGCKVGTVGDGKKMEKRTLGHLGVGQDPTVGHIVPPTQDDQ